MLCMLVLILSISGACTSTSEGISDSSDIECPPTPDWYDPQDTHGSFFRERYQGVNFEAPDRHYFAASSSTEAQPSTLYSQSIDDCNLNPLHTSFNRLSHGASGSSSLQSGKPRKRVTFAPEVYILSKPFDHDARLNKVADQMGALAPGRDTNAGASSSHVGTSSDASEFESEDEMPDSTEVSEDEEVFSAEENREPRNRKATMSPQEKEEMRKRLIEIWKANDYNCKMHPQDLAAKMAKIRVLWVGGNDRVLGNLASNIVRSSASEAYHKRYLLFSRRFSQKICKLKKKMPIEYPDYTEQEILRHLLKKIDDFQAHCYDEWVDPRPTPKQSEVKATKRALEAGKALTEIASEALHDPTISAEDLSIAQIEFYSRHLTLDGVHPTTTTNSLRRYIKKILKRSNEDLDQFSILRTEYQIGMVEKKQREKTLQAKRRVLQGRE